MATAERNHGVIPDRSAWDLPLDGATATEAGGTQVFRAVRDQEARPGIRALARTAGLGMYARAFEDGGGENGLHSHPDDAIWLVLQGRATFFAEGGHVLGDLGPHDGILVPGLTSYRFVCTGPSLLARLSAPSTTD